MSRKDCVEVAQLIADGAACLEPDDGTEMGTGAITCHQNDSASFILWVDEQKFRVIVEEPLE